jgi:hypothetical protein
MSARLALAVLAAAGLLGCRKAGTPRAVEPSGAQPKVSVESIASDQTSTPVPPPPAAAEQPPEPSVAAPTSASKEARKKRNLEWLKILATGNAQQKQKVQDQLTLLGSDELTELSELYDQQKRK